MRRQFDARAQSLPVHTTHSPLTRRCFGKAQHHQTNRTSQQAQWLPRMRLHRVEPSPPARHDKNTMKSRQLKTTMHTKVKLYRCHSVDKVVAAEYQSHGHNKPIISRQDDMGVAWGKGVVARWSWAAMHLQVAHNPLYSILCI